MDIDKFIQENMFVIEHPNGESESVISTDDVREFFSQQLAKPVDEQLKAEREDAIMLCAEIAGRTYKVYEDTKDAHERFSKEPFNPASFSFDMESINRSRLIQEFILDLLSTDESKEKWN